MVGAEDFANRIVLDKAGILGQSQEVGLEYVLALKPDRLLAPVYNALGKSSESKGSPYGGWESRQIAGHSLGHYLSSLAGFWEATHDPRVKEKLDYTVAALKKLQADDGYLGGVPEVVFNRVFSGNFAVDNFSLGGYWVPWYSVHKIYAGLIDAYVNGGNEDALKIVRGMADWVVKGSASMSDASFQKMLTCEHGGMCKVMADLYGITGEKSYLELSKRFIHHAVMDPLMNEKDALQGLHANTQIPKVIGLARLYELTGEERYRKGAEFFFNTVVDHRSYVIGGNSLSEHFGASDTEPLGRDTCETCNTYNMMELAEHLFDWTGDVKFADYYERAQLNHILASQEPETGAKQYFMPTQAGQFKIYGTQDNSFWCCTGTGMENPERYNRFVWAQRDKILYLNLFAASTLSGDGYTLKVETNFPYSEEATVRVVKASNTMPSLMIRAPEWLASPLTVKAGGKEYTKDAGDYLALKGPLASGDIISIKLPMALTRWTAKGDASNFAFEYGPVVLAARLGTEGFPKSDTVADHLSLMKWPQYHMAAVILDSDKPADFLEPKDLSKLVFKTRAGALSGGIQYEVIPYFALHHERYALYFSTGKGAEGRDERFGKITRDTVKPGEQQSEIEHGFTSAGANMGYNEALNMHWRDARGEGSYLAYSMELDPSGGRLQVTYNGSEGRAPGLKRKFRILVNGVEIASVELNGSGEDRTVDERYSIPKEAFKGLSAGSDGLVKAEIRFVVDGKRDCAGSILEIRSITGK